MLYPILIVVGIIWIIKQLPESDKDVLNHRDYDMEHEAFMERYMEHKAKQRALKLVVNNDKV